MKKKPWLENVTEDDMPNDELKYLACILGIPATLELIDQAPGIIINIPKNAFKLLKDKYILNNYDGTKLCMVKMAIELNVTERYIYRILKTHGKRDAFKQIRLFEETEP